MLTIHRILVPVDFSACSRQALDVAVELARTFSARLDVLHVFEEPAFPSFYGTGALALYGKVPDLEVESRKALKKLSRSIQTPGLELETHLRTGPAADEITRFAAERDVDLIVIATHGLRGLQHVLLGSVAERVVREAPCPVFVVKSHGKPISSKTNAGARASRAPEPYEIEDSVQPD